MARANGYGRTSGKRRGLSIGAALALGFAALLGGLLIGRASAPSSATSQVASAGVGPSHSVNRVAVGYAHTRAGAAQAVAKYQQAFADPAILRPRVLRRRIRTVATPDYAATMLQVNAPGKNRIAAGPIGQGLAHGTQTLYSGVPIGYRIESYSRDRARVLTWGFTLLGNASAVEPEAYFGVTHTELVWRDGDWKIANTRGGFGPTPKIETPAGPVGGFEVLQLAKELRTYGVTP